MQLCEFCTQYDTCKLEKRARGMTFASCDYFERQDMISQERYEAVKNVLLHLRDDPEARPKIERHIHIDIPMAFTEKDILSGWLDIPRDLHLDFCALDLNAPPAVTAFLDRQEIMPFCHRARSVDADALLRDLKAVQADLKGMMSRWGRSPADFGVEEFPLNLESREDIVAEVYRDAQSHQLPSMTKGAETDIFRLDAWIHSTLEFSVERNETGAIKPYARLATRYWPGILYFLFAKDVIEEQEYQRCPVCKIIFRSDIKKGPPGATCGKPKCRTYFSEHKEELIRGG